MSISLLISPNSICVKVHLGMTEYVKLRVFDLKTPDATMSANDTELHLFMFFIVSH